MIYGKIRLKSQERTNKTINLKSCDGLLDNYHIFTNQNWYEFEVKNELDWELFWKSNGVNKLGEIIDNPINIHYQSQELGEVISKCCGSSRSIIGTITVINWQLLRIN